MAGPKKWRRLFNRFISQLRITSKEVSSGTDSRGVKLELWESQRRYLDMVVAGLEEDIHDFTCLKSRQLGVTTISLAIDLFWLAIHPGIIGALVVDTEPNRDTFREVLRRYIQSFPADFVGKGFSLVKGGDNRNYMKFSNGSRLDFLVAGTSRRENWGESRAYTLVHETEVSKYGSPAGIKNFEEGFSTANPDRLIMRESTANGMNHWKNMWDAAGQDEFTRRRIFIGWWANALNAISRRDRRFQMYGGQMADEVEREFIAKVKADYDWEITIEQLAWYRWRSADASATQEGLDQNQPWYAEQAFVLSGYSYFQSRKLQNEMNAILTGETAVQFEGFRFWLGNEFFASKMEKIYTQDRLREVELRVWEQPKKEGHYVIGCDPAFGRNDNKNNHAISVWRCFADKLVQVAEYADHNFETRQAAWVLAYLAGSYRNCILNVEVTGGPGHAIMTEMDNVRRQLRAEVYNKKAEELGWTDFLSTARWYLYHKPDNPGTGYVYNWNSNHDAKVRMLSSYRDAHVTDALVIRSLQLLNEMNIVVQDGSEIGAPSGQNDDRVFAAGLACLAWNEWIRGPLLSQGYLYENQMLIESGQASAAHNMMTRLVQNTLKRMAELPDEADDPDRKFMEERGLV